MGRTEAVQPGQRRILDMLPAAVRQLLAVIPRASGGVPSLGRRAFRPGREHLGQSRPARLGPEPFQILAQASTNPESHA